MYQDTGCVRRNHTIIGSRDNIPGKEKKMTEIEQRLTGPSRTNYSPDRLVDFRCRIQALHRKQITVLMNKMSIESGGSVDKDDAVGHILNMFFGEHPV